MMECALDGTAVGLYIYHRYISLDNRATLPLNQLHYCPHVRAGITG